MTKRSLRMLPFTLGLLAPIVAFAGSGEAPDSSNAEARERRMRMLRLVGLADALSLSDMEALRMGEVLRRFDERRRPLKRQVAASTRVLKQAALGDSAAQPQVDAAMQRLLDARAELALLEREQFLELSKGMSTEKKAKMAVFFAQFRKDVKAARKLREVRGWRDRDAARGRRKGGS